jgi:hypothetical protein
VTFLTKHENSSVTLESFFDSSTAYTHHIQDAGKFGLSAAFVAMSIATSSLTLAGLPRSFDSSLTSSTVYKPVLRRRIRSVDNHLNPLCDFAVELQQQSASLSHKDAALYREIVLENMEPGVSNF